MAKFTVFTRNACAFCTAAKETLRSLGYEYDEININTNPERADELFRRSPGLKGRPFTVPQIFVGDHLIGGYTELRDAVQNKTLSILVDLNS